MELTEQEKEKSQCKGCIFNVNFTNCIHAGRVEMEAGIKCLSKKTSWDIFDEQIKKIDEYIQEDKGVPRDVCDAYHHGVRGFMSAMSTRASLLQKHIDNKTIEVESRSEETGLRFHNSIKQAFERAEKDQTVWKISFSAGGERVRLVKTGIKYEGKELSSEWAYEPVIDEETLKEIKRKR